ncbi:hypothetical protein [Leptothermofonsia sp. ETS-13]
MTQHADFAERSRLYGSLPPKLVGLRCGNAPTNHRDKVSNSRLECS